MTDLELQHLVVEISLTFFQRPFKHQAFFNRRLQTTGGRYHLTDHHLDFNPLVLEKYGLDELVAVIKHELCHYHLHLTGGGYRHGDQDFKRLLQQTGGSRYVQNLQGATEQWCYGCEKCRQRLFRKRRINTEKYVCGRCGGQLTLQGRAINHA